MEKALLVVKHSSIRMILALVADRNMELEQLDFKTAFLHHQLEETVYMQQPEGFVKDNFIFLKGLILRKWLTDLGWDAKPVSTPMVHHFKLTSSESPSTDEEEKFMAIWPMLWVWSVGSWETRGRPIGGFEMDTKVSKGNTDNLSDI